MSFKLFECNQTRLPTSQVQAVEYVMLGERARKIVLEFLLKICTIKLQAMKKRHFYLFILR